MELLLGSLLIFVLRITDVSIGTVRVMLMVRGQRLHAVLLGFLESGVFVVAVSQVLKDIGAPGNWPKMLAYAAGFATGTFVGMTLERWIASGSILARIVSKGAATPLAEALRREHFGVTRMRGEGREGELSILFVVAPRRRGDELLKIVSAADPDAFITIDSITDAIGGYIPRVAEPSSVRK
jgi:uncharacterized protein YebE (UPF0316 family)